MTEDIVILEKPPAPPEIAANDSPSDATRIGATLGTPYNVSTTANIVLFNKGAASPSYAVLPLANTMSSLNPVLFKDRNGDAFTDNITISFSGGEACDGSSTVVLNNAYAWARIAPYPGGGGWYQC